MKQISEIDLSRANGAKRILGYKLCKLCKNYFPNEAIRTMHKSMHNNHKKTEEFPLLLDYYNSMWVVPKNKLNEQWVSLYYDKDAKITNKAKRAKFKAQQEHLTWLEERKAENIKKTKALKDLALIKQSRLSVMPIDTKGWKVILKMGNIL